jgi:diguanylate cyclase (GGDEF)-like protein/PAS domain S-box-containing protein
MDVDVQFKSYFNLGLIGMAITSIEKGWVEVNGKLCEILGYPQNELIRLSWTEITYLDDLDAEETEFARVLSGEIEGYSIDKRFIRKDGSVIYASISTNCVRRDDRRIDHFVTFIQDITERKQAEEVINKAYSLLKTAEKLAHIGSWEWDIEKDKFTMSDEWLRMHGVTTKNITMDELIPIAHPDDVKIIEKHFKDALDGIQTYELIHRFIKQDDGEIRFVNSKGIVSFDKQGKPYKVQGTAQDITEKVKAEQTLKESEARFKSLFEESPFGIILCEAIKNKQGRMINYLHIQGNKSVVKHLGIKGKYIIGKTALDMNDSKQIRNDIVRLGRMLSSGESFSYTEYYNLINKSVQITAFPLNSDQFILNFIDVTEHKQAEKELEDHRNNLEELVKKRTHDLTTVNKKLTTEIVKREKIETKLVDKEANLIEAQRIGKLGSWQLNIANDKIVWSEELFNMYGFDPSQPAPLYIEHHKLFTPKSWDKLSFALTKIRDTGTPYELVLETVRKDRKNGWMLVRGEAIRNVNGLIVSLHGVAQDITQRKKAEEKLERIAHYDVLTNLPNRVLLADRLNQAMAQCFRRNKSLAVAFMDLDGFKEINDNHGHNVGDELLIAVSHRMQGALREGDTLARIGGDEFIAVLVDLDNIEDSQPVLDRLLKAAAEPITLGDDTMCVSASIGVTLYPQDGADADQLMRHADQAMYVAKQAGKNRYHVFDIALDNAVTIQRENIGDIRTAINRHEFVLHYQPKINMNTREVVGVEGLIRWQHPINGLVHPLSFLAAIEWHAVSLELGEWVINSALSQISQWKAMGINLPISVNISAYQLQQDNFTARLATLLAGYPDVSPQCLELEILEISALKDTNKVSATMNACRELGVSFALDDFGTGYSSLTYLKRLPAYLIKIDQSFVRDMLDDPDDLAIVEGVVGLAKAFQRDVIAEGVETVAHGAALVKLGCKLAQGYGIARPMPPANIPKWLADWKADESWRFDSTA